METPPGPSPCAQADYEEAALLMSQGQPPEAVRQRLIGKGLDPQAATAVVNDLILKALYAQADFLLKLGNSPEEARRKLVEAGVSEQVASAVVANAPSYARKARGHSGAGNALHLLLGVLIFMLGIGLWIGNRTGLFPTFPFAGFIVMAIGSVVLQAACRWDNGDRSGPTPRLYRKPFPPTAGEKGGGEGATPSQGITPTPRPLPAAALEKDFRNNLSATRGRSGD
jgi:hypothetical protein